MTVFRAQNYSPEPLPYAKAKTLRTVFPNGDGAQAIIPTQGSSMAHAADGRFVDVAREREALSEFQHASMGMRVAVASAALSREDQVRVDRFGEHPAFRPLVASLERLGFEVLVIDPSQLAAVSELRPDELVFIHMHGEFGEDGRLQGLLDYHGVPYTGSGVLASAVGLDKERFKRVLRGSGLPTPDWQVLDPGRALDQQVIEAADAMPGPWIVKPISGGSSIATALVTDREELFVACELAQSDVAYPVLIEQFVAGEMLTVGVLQLPSTLVALPVVRVLLEGPIFDLEAKLQSAQKPSASSLEVPAAIGEELAVEVRQAALDVHSCVGCVGFSRVDMILRGDGAIEILEINTIPGISPGSSFVQAARAVGLSYDDVLLAMVRAARRPGPASALATVIERLVKER